MEKAISQKTQSAKWLTFACLSLLGCGLIILSSFIRIPFYPVPFTLQTLAIAIIALTQSPKQALGSVGCYLLFASIGLPVFGGKANLLWFAGNSAGYLVAFPIAAYMISALKGKISPFLSLLCGQMIIYLLGFLWLSNLFGYKVAFLQGVVFFIPSDLLKNLIALVAVSSWRKWRHA